MKRRSVWKRQAGADSCVRLAGGRASRWPVCIVIVTLAAALLACTMSMSGGDDTSGRGDSADTGGSGVRVGQGIAPSVRVREPANNAQVPIGQPVDIVVETDATTTYFLLNVGGRVASSVAMPGEQSGPTTAILRWTPERAGLYNLEVFAFNGDAGSAPALLALNASGSASGSGAGDNAATCTGRVLVSKLNFRDGPGTSREQLGQFDVGESVVVIGRDAGTGWYQIQRFNSQQVWVINNRQWFQVEGQCNSLPVVG